jgi:hypothetical protein
MDGLAKTRKVGSSSDMQEILVNASGDVEVMVNFASVDEGGALHCDELNGEIENWTLTIRLQATSDRTLSNIAALVCWSAEGTCIAGRSYQSSFQNDSNIRIMADRAEGSVRAELTWEAKARKTVGVYGGTRGECLQVHRNERHDTRS